MQHHGRAADDQGRSEDLKREATGSEGFDIHGGVENGKPSRLQTSPASRLRYIAE